MTSKDLRVSIVTWRTIEQLCARVQTNVSFCVVLELMSADLFENLL